MSVWEIVPPLPADDPNTPEELTVQVNVVPETVLNKFILAAPPEQSCKDVGDAVPTGVGFTVTVTVYEAPEHPPAVGMMVYVAVPAVDPVADSVCAIELPLPFIAPDTPAWVTVQVNVVGVMVLARVIELDVPEQIVCAVTEAEPTGKGLTVIVPSIDACRHGEPVVVTV